MSDLGEVSTEDLEAKRHMALSNQRAVEYYLQNIEGGFTPEDIPLHEKGMLEYLEREAEIQAFIDRC